VQWRSNPTRLVDPFPDRYAQLPGHQDRGRRVQEVESHVPVSEPDLQGVPETFGADEAGLGALVLDEGVESHRGAVDEQACFAQDLVQRQSALAGHLL
jgi:hypothetical protein